MRLVATDTTQIMKQSIPPVLAWLLLVYLGSVTAQVRLRKAPERALRGITIATASGVPQTRVSTTETWLQKRKKPAPASKLCKVTRRLQDLGGDKNRPATLHHLQDALGRQTVRIR
jgi:hypothetical protein